MAGVKEEGALEAAATAARVAAARVAARVAAWVALAAGEAICKTPPVRCCSTRVA